jgi:phospho-N-acetylmuramoyl-pentapeptide-transferase
MQQFNIHAHKAGTPTMGGLLIVLATVTSAFVFCDLTNSYVWLVMLVMLGGAAIGFADDYLKIREHNHKGVSARGKLLGQMAIGCFLGAALYFGRPQVAYGPLLFTHSDIPRVDLLAERLRDESNPLMNYLRSKFTVGDWAMLTRFGGPDGPQENDVRTMLVGELNDILRGENIYDKERFQGIVLSPEAMERRDWQLSSAAEGGISTRLNRFLLDSAFPTALRHNNLIRGNDHVLVPFFKMVYPALGAWFILWVALVLTATSNAVNLTDGLDGLAIGTVITVTLPYIAITYLVSRFDFSSYLYIPHVPWAGELAVFLSAMLGASLGFLWFNSHPAEVFMGDTGSLSLGATLGAVALLCKHEVLLILVGGIFVIEALSVVLQVGSYKLRGKRVLLMSPLHNHFVKKGVAESKIIARFLIVSILLALAGLCTLKLR